MITVYVRYLKTGESYPINTTCKIWGWAVRQARQKAWEVLGWLPDETTVSIANPKPIRGS